MKLEDVRIAVVRIEHAKDDYEVAHGLEDGLHHDFIAHIATLSMLPNLSAMAKEILKTDNIDFPRHCA